MKKMNEVNLTRVESRDYVSPKMEVLHFQPEGVLCASVGGDHEGFEPGGEYEID